MPDYKINFKELKARVGVTDVLTPSATALTARPAWGVT